MVADASNTPAASGDDEHTGRGGVESGFVRTNDVETYYERRGDGPPVLFVHGMAMNTEQWAPQVTALADEFTTVAYDVRGHGRTGGSDRERYDVALYASDLRALTDELAVERPVVCGLSMGGCIAQAYAARYPDDVAGLILCDTFTAGPLPLRGRLVFENLRFMARLERLVPYRTLNRLQLWVGQRLQPGIAGDAAAIQRVVESGPEITHAEFVKIAKSVAAFPRSDFDTAAISAPTLVLYGEHNPSVFVANHRQLAANLTNADVELTVVPAAGHASNLDNPAFFTDTVRRFAARVHRSSN